MPNLKLTWDEYEVRSDEVLVIAIHAPGLVYYKMAHFLNKRMHWNLVNIKRISQIPDMSDYFLEVFAHTDSINRIQYFLVENRFEKQYWIPKMSDVDYWIVVAGSGLEYIKLEDLLQALSQTEFVFSAAHLPFENTSRTSSLFTPFQTFYNEMDNRGIIHHFE